MKKRVWMVLGVGLFVCLGCKTTETDRKDAPTTVRALTPPPPPVTVEMITESNYRHMMQKLADEIQRDSYADRLPSN
jgi:hypothetical protein